MKVLSNARIAPIISVLRVGLLLFGLGKGRLTVQRHVLMDCATRRLLRISYNELPIMYIAEGRKDILAKH